MGLSITTANRFAEMEIGKESRNTGNGKWVQVPQNQLSNFMDGKKAVQVQKVGQRGWKIS